MDRSITAADIMVTRLTTLRPDTHVYDGIALLLKKNLTGSPVVDEHQQYLGVFSEKSSMNVLGVLADAASRDPNVKQVHVAAKDIMTKQLITLSPEAEALDAIELLLKNQISGAPVVDTSGNFLGVFSEKDSMRVLISAAYEQLPISKVGRLMNRDQGRVVAADTDLFDLAEMFVDTHYRRLVVVEDGKLVGQISRRDILRANGKRSTGVMNQIADLAPSIRAMDDAATIGCSHGDDPNTVGYFMDRCARTIEPDTDFLKIADLFLHTPYRRLPVLKDGEVVGQVSRRDVLNAAVKQTKLPREQEKSLLYLSALVSRDDAPTF